MLSAIEGQNGNKLAGHAENLLAGRAPPRRAAAHERRAPAGPGRRVGGLANYGRWVADADAHAPTTVGETNV
jgi:hypothetical protein